MKRIACWLAAALILTLAPRAMAQGAGATGSPVNVEVGGFPNDQGRLACALYNGPDGFPRDRNKAIQHATGKISEGRATCVFNDIPTGTYAIAFFHDAKMTGKMVKNMLGIPQEGYGFSNDAKPSAMSPPSFSAAAFQHDGTKPTTLKLILQKF
jgi:uncharacterized protein (DUF2141 family)